MRYELTDHEWAAIKPFSAEQAAWSVYSHDTDYFMMPSISLLFGKPVVEPFT